MAAKKIIYQQSTKTGYSLHVTMEQSESNIPNLGFYISQNSASFDGTFAEAQKVLESYGVRCSSVPKAGTGVDGLKQEKSIANWLLQLKLPQAHTREEQLANVMKLLGTVNCSAGEAGFKDPSNVESMIDTFAVIAEIDKAYPAQEREAAISPAQVKKKSGSIVKGG